MAYKSAHCGKMRCPVFLLNVRAASEWPPVKAP